MADVFANGRSILHKGHGQTQLAVAPDVCKTPSPGGPVPIPYPNFSSDSNLTKGAKSVKINGNPAANTGSKLSRSNGDEPGTAGGVVSSKNMGTFGWPAGSVDVQAEGKSVVRLLDAHLTNGNTYNDTGVTLGEPAIAYGDDAECPRHDCRLNRVLEDHMIPDQTESMNAGQLCAAFAAEVAANLRGQLKKSRYGRMVGVGVCQCPKEWRAISGRPIVEADQQGAARALVTQPGFCNAVAARPGDQLFSDIQGQNPQWDCAALKILSNAGSGHKIVSLSERWVGKPRKDGTATPKTFSTQDFLYPVRSSSGMLIQLPATASDRVRGLPADVTEIPSGGKVPSCGTCQTFLPALVCTMEDC